MKNISASIGKLAGWINEHIVGNAWSLIGAIVFVVILYLLLLVQGYSKWNLSTGLFGNDIESAYELITGTASVVAVVALHKTVKKHHADMKEVHQQHTTQLTALHEKLDKALELRAPKV